MTLMMVAYRRVKKNIWTDVWQHLIAISGKYLYVFSEQMLSCHCRICRSTQICIRRKREVWPVLAVRIWSIIYNLV
jgi:hypothetical protein